MSVHSYCIHLRRITMITALILHGHLMLYVTLIIRASSVLFLKLHNYIVATVLQANTAKLVRTGPKSNPLFWFIGYH